MMKATNLSVDAELLDEAKNYGINLSQTFREALAEKLKEERARRWLRDNSDALEAYGRYLDENELVADRLKAF